MVTYDIEIKILKLSKEVEKYKKNSYDIINSNFKPNFFTGHLRLIILIF